MKYNLKHIMTHAWEIFRKNTELTFGEALHRSWLSEKAIPVNEALIAEAKAEAGVDEECNTWAGWKKLGFEVIHGSKGDGAVYKARFFGFSQVQAAAA